MANSGTFNDVAIIFNPNSTGDAPSNARKLQAELKHAAIAQNVSLLPAESAGHAVELAYDFAKQHSNALIVSASGDGGYNEVVNGALRAQNEGAHPICAVLPSGNANDHARTMQQEPLVELIKKQSITKLDVMKLTIKEPGKTVTRYAHSYAGIGLTPQVAVELNKHSLNRFREKWIVVSSFFSFKAVTIIADGMRLKVDSLTCSTIPEMAKVLSFSDKAHPRDGLFEVTILEHAHKLRLLQQLVRGVVAHMPAAKRVKEYQFTTVRPTALQCDGEIVSLPKNAVITVALQPGLLRTIAATPN